MLLDVRNASGNPGQSIPFEGGVVIEPMEVLDDPVSFEGTAVRGTMVGDGHTVAVSGHITSNLHTRCSNCLEDVVLPLETDFSELYGEEANPDDPDQLILVGHTVDLTDPVREALLLEMPMRVLCRPDCKGLCPRCGANLNKQLCTCQEGAAIENPFSALSAMLSKNEEV
ncbi:MAG: DUF177 domain-containing protein [Clostridia bacterium]|nr:DUF177 domain-containing protein [Clostridia bacterium]